MTIFDSGYSSFEYEPVGPLRRIWPLVRMEFGKIFRKRLSLMLFVACVVYVVVLLILVFVNLDPASEDIQAGLKMMSPKLNPFEREFYMSYSLDWGFLAFVLLTSLVGVRSIAGDKAVNALEIFWTRGIGPWGYFLGKWMGSFLLLATVFVAGPLVAWLYGLLSAPDALFFTTTIEFMPQVLLALVLKCLVLSFLAVSFSALGTTPNAVTFLWLIVILGSAALVRVLKVITRLQRHRTPERVHDDPIWFDALCPWDATLSIEKDLTGLTESTDHASWISWLALGLLALFLFVRLRKNLRITEVMT